MPDNLIFIVDDEPSITEPLTYALQTDGFEVESFTLGGALLQRLDERKPTLIVLDVGLPDINGFNLFRTIKESSDIPVIFLTARGDEIDRVVGLELGADDYVVKPFSPREVAARIRVIIKRCQPVSPQTANNASLLINRETARAVFFGKELALTRYEFLILAELAEQPMRVLSRSQLIDAIWPERSGSMERSVDTHIKTLRAKLRDVRDDIDVIKTHRGLGYSFEATDA